MIPNNNLSIMPIYDQLARQNHRKDFAYGEIYPLITPMQRLLPFQRVRPTSAATVQALSVKLRTKDGAEVIDISNQMRAAGLKINRYQSLGFDVIIYPAAQDLNIEVEPGRYYLEITDGAQSYFSELFNLVLDVSQFLKIEFWDTENIEINGGLIDFTDGFKFTLYLDTQIGRPEYEFEEELTRRDGYQFIEKQLSEKTFKFNFLAPEYLCDAMRIIRMMDNIAITSRGESYTADQFLITPKWQAGGYYAAVEAEFQCDTIIKKIGARYVSTGAADPGANEAKVYVGLTVEATPSELAVKALTEKEAIKQNITNTQVLELGKRFCVAYPAEWGDLKEVKTNESFDILRVFDKRVVDFTFGASVVAMNVYTYKSPITYLGTPNPPQTINYNFTASASQNKVGDLYAGGKIAYLFQPGEPGYIDGETHGIIAAPYDTPAGGIQWAHPNWQTQIGAALEGIGEGRENTLDIISIYSMLSPWDANFAALAARNVGIGDYSDWFLPSIGELDKLYDVKDIVGGFGNQIYWSSTELPRDAQLGGIAYAKVFNGVSAGQQRQVEKASVIPAVRAIRYF